MKAPEIPAPECPHVYVWKGVGAGSFKALPSEMDAWYARPLWWRLCHPFRAPWRIRAGSSEGPQA